VKTEDLIGITLYSETLDEAMQALTEQMKSDNKDTLSACARGLGHLARRYQFRDNDLIKEITDSCRKLNLISALNDMNDDLDHFVPEG
jgi:hypothetical protein